MKRFLTAALMLAACGSGAQQIKATPEEVTGALGRPDMEVSVLAWGAVDLKHGSECVFVLTETLGDQGVTILERHNNELTGAYASSSWNGARAVRSAVTDMGHDGKKEVEVRLDNGRRIYYLWNDKGWYKGEDAVAYHSMSGHGEFRDEVFHKDLDGDGIEEALVVFGHSFSGASGPSPFDARK